MSVPLIVLPSLVLQRESSSIAIVVRSIVALVPLSPAGQLPPSLFAVSISAGMALLS